MSVSSNLNIIKLGSQKYNPRNIDSRDYDLK